MKPTEQRAEKGKEKKGTVVLTVFWKMVWEMVMEARGRMGTQSPRGNGEQSEPAHSSALIHCSGGKMLQRGPSGWRRGHSMDRMTANETKGKVVRPTGLPSRAGRSRASQSPARPRDAVGRKKTTL